MTAPTFDISSFRAEPTPSSNASSRSDRTDNTAFADILRAQKSERDVPSNDTYDNDAPRDEAPAAVDKPAPRQSAKEKDAPAKPRRNDTAKDDSAPAANEAAASDEPAQPKAANETKKDGTEKDAAAKDNNSTPKKDEEKPTDVSALTPLVTEIVPVQIEIKVLTNTPDLVRTAEIKGAIAPAQAAAPKAAASAVPDAQATPQGAQAQNAAAQAAATALPTEGEIAPETFEQLVAAAKAAAPAAETRKTKTSDAAAPAKTDNSAATGDAKKPQAATAAQPAANAAAAPAQPAQAPAATTAAPQAPTNTDATATDTAAEADNASVATLIARPAAPRQANNRPVTNMPVDVNAIPEPVLSDAASAETPAPRPGNGTLTAATGLAAQVKGQEMQGPAQPNADAQTNINADKTATDAVAAKAAAIDGEPNVEKDNTPSTAPTARATDPQVPQQAHDSSVRSTSFADALSAARGSRASANPLVAQVVVQVSKAVADGNDRITIKLSPADLGRIDVRLDIGTDGKIQAVFAADKPQTVEMLQRDARELERSLQDAGLRADSGSLSFNLRGEQHDQNNSGFASSNSGRGTSKVDDLPELPPAVAQAYTANNSGNGRLDIQV